MTDLAQLVSHGSLRCQFDLNWKIDLLELTTIEHSEYVPRQQLIRSAAESPDIKQSPNTSKASGKRAQQQRQKQQQAQDQPAPKLVPSSMVTEYGLTSGAQQYLEVSDPQSSYHRALNSSKHLFSWQKPCQSWPTSSPSLNLTSTSPPLTLLPNSVRPCRPNTTNNINSNSNCYNSSSSNNSNRSSSKYNNNIIRRNSILSSTTRANNNNTT